MQSSTSWIWFVSLLVYWLPSLSAAIAQITPDSTLPVNSSVTPGCTTCIINGGTERGVNLYHSFREFSVPTGGAAWFNNSAQIQNILTRVTTNSISNIDGLIRTNGAANLFLLNPNGIVFGPNARLQIGGSFLASTATSFKLPDGSEFSAINPQAPPLLLVNITPGLQIGTSQPETTIINRGELIAGQDLTLEADKLDIQGTLRAGNNLTLQAATTVQVRDTESTAFSAQSGNHLTIQGNQGIDILTLNHPNQTPFISSGDLNLISNGTIATDAHFTSQGNIVIATSDRTTPNSPPTAKVISRQDPIFNSAGDFSLPLPYEGLSLQVNADGNITFGEVNINGIDPAIAPTPALILNAGGTITGTGTVSTTVPTGNLLVQLQSQGNVNTRDIITRGGDLTITSQSGSIATAALRTSVTSDNTRSDPLNGGAIQLQSRGNIQTNAVDSFSDQPRRIGNGGNISIISETGRVTTGQIYSYAEDRNSNSSQAGGINISANTGIATTFILSKAPGRGGDVELTTASGNILVTPLADSIQTRSNTQQAGNIKLTATTGRVILPAEIVATGRTQAGNVTIHAQSGIQVNNIDVFSRQGGNGGNVQLTTNRGDIVVNQVFSYVDGGSNDGKGGDVALKVAEYGNIYLNLPILTYSNRNSGGRVAIETAQGDISLKGVLTDARGGGNTNSEGVSGGDIWLKTVNGAITAYDLVAFANGNGSGGKIDVSAQDGSLNLHGAFTFGGRENSVGGRGNSVDLRATGDITINAINATGRQASGEITITAGGTFLANLLERDVRGKYSSVIANDTFGTGAAGNIQITARSIILPEGAQISSSTHNRGTGGNVTLTAFEHIDISGLIPQGVRPGTEALTGLAGVPEGSYWGGYIPTGDNSNSDPSKIDYPAGVYTQTTLRSTGNAGNIAITTPRLTIREGGAIAATTFGQQNSGSILIQSPNGSIEVQGGKIQSGVGSAQSQGSSGSVTLNTRSLTVTNGGLVQTQTLGRGTAGAIEINADTVNLAGQGSTIRSGSGDALIRNEQVGAGGDIRLMVRSLNVLDLATLSAETFTNARGGAIFVTGSNLNAQNSGQLRTSTFGAGQAGDIVLALSDRLFLSDPGSGLFANTEVGSSGNGGSITATMPTALIQNQAGIAADSRSRGSGGSIRMQNTDLILSDRGYITAETVGSGNAGTIEINANQVRLTGVGTAIRSGSGNERLPNLQAGAGGDIRLNVDTLNLTNGSSLSAQTFSRAQGGNVLVTGNRFIADNQGQVRTTTFGAGQAGNIILTLRDRLFLSDPGTGLFADTEIGSTGNGGSIFIDPPTVFIQKGAGVGVDSRGTGPGGNLTIRAGNLTLDQQAFLTAETASAQGGNIVLDISDILLLRRNSLISATAGNAQAGGDGGNISIRAPFIVGVLSENSDITANAFTGNGGRINITTNAIYGLQLQSRLTPFSDITASSEFGVSGVVAINTLNVDPNRGLVALPTNFVDPSQRISQDCTPGSPTATGRNTFVITGRGGLPNSPEAMMTSDEPLVELVTLPPAQPNQTEIPIKTAFSELPATIAEAQGWSISSEGLVYLVSQSSIVTPNLPAFNLSHCQ